MSEEKRKLLKKERKWKASVVISLLTWSAAWSCTDSIRIFTARRLYQYNNYTCFSSADITADCTPLRAGSNLPSCLENIQYFHKQPPSTTRQTLPTPCYALEIEKKGGKNILLWFRSQTGKRNLGTIQITHSLLQCTALYLTQHYSWPEHYCPSQCPLSTENLLQPTFPSLPCLVVAEHTEVAVLWILPSSTYVFLNKKCAIWYRKPQTHSLKAIFPA